MSGVIFLKTLKEGVMNISEWKIWFIPVGELFVSIFNLVMNLVYGFYFALVKAVAWILDLLTQLFFIFSGMTPISSGAVDAEGNAIGTDIVNHFLTNSAFQKAYLYLCLVAFGLVVVFTITKIIKQDYFEKSGTSGNKIGSVTVRSAF